MTTTGKVAIISILILMSIVVVLAWTAPEKPQEAAREKPARFEVVETFAVLKQDHYITSTAEVIKDKVTGKCYLWISNRFGGLTDFDCEDIR